jgi:ADP-heptose:LPS heptosyltransferase
VTSFLIVRLGSLGDVIHAIPAAAALRTAFSNARIDWMVDPQYVELLNLVEGVDTCIPVDTRGSNAALASTLRRVAGLVAMIPDADRVELDRLLGRVSQIARRIESNVAAIVHASRSNAHPEIHHRELPPELARVLSTFTERLEEIPTKDRS